MNWTYLIIVVVALYYFIRWLRGCNHDWVAPANHNFPVFCRKCHCIGIGPSMPNDRVPAATAEEEKARLGG